MVKVSGTLINDRFPQPGSPVVIRQATYVVTGQQTYDPALKEWVAGNLEINVTHQLEADGKKVGLSQGKIAAKFERLPTDK